MRSPTLRTPLSSSLDRAWSAGQVFAVITTLMVLVGLVVRPEETLRVAWFGIVPLLPATFLINAGLWRGVCPIATANTIWSGPKRTPGARWMRTASVLGILLLLVLVPMRRLVLNQGGTALAVTLVLIVATALILGRIYRTKAGFCNSLCPILPVEKLYGQSPLVWIQNPRCLPCDHCSIRGCLDLNPSAAPSQPKGPGSTRLWLRSPMGLFAMAFPGLVFGYFQTADGTVGDWLQVYGAVGAYVLLSLLVLGTISYALNPDARLLAPIFGALAAGIYYWFAAPASIDAFGGSALVGEVLRWMLTAFVAFWLWRATKPWISRAGRQRPSGSAATRSA